MHSEQGNAVRNRTADGLDRIAVSLWSLAHRLRPVYEGAVCPDCNSAPDYPDGECPVCRDRYEQQKTEEAIYGAGFEDGHRAGASDNEQRYHGDWG